MLGYEFEVMSNTSLGVRYIRRTIGRVLEDVAAAPMVAYDLGLTEGVEYILTESEPRRRSAVPELGARFEDPIHNYDAVELTLDRRFSGKWQGTASYRWSRLNGTFEGFYREDNGQSDPGITSLYDFPTNDPSYTPSAARSSATRATSASSASSAGARCRSIVRTSSSSTATMR